MLRGPSYSWKKALVLIFFSTLFSLTLFAFLQRRGDRPVEAIVQEPLGEALNSQCLAELLSLSIDEPLSFAHFPLQQAKERLLETAIIEEASLSKIRPNILYIRYRLREPLALLGNMSNRAIDKEGVIFPLEPFFSKRELPTVYTKGLGHEIFLDLLHYPIAMIDLLDIDALTLGRRQIVVQMQDGAWLRLPVCHYREALDHYLLLAKKADMQGKIVDLRIPNTAYIRNE